MSKRKCLSRPTPEKRIKSLFAAMTGDLVAFLAALAAAAITAWALVPAAYEWRGYVAYGGEWIAIVFVAAFTFYVASNAIDKNNHKNRKRR